MFFSQYLVLLAGYSQARMVTKRITSRPSRTTWAPLGVVVAERPVMAESGHLAHLLPPYDIPPRNRGPTPKVAPGNYTETERVEPTTFPGLDVDMASENEHSLARNYGTRLEK